MAITLPADDDMTETVDNIKFEQGPINSHPDHLKADENERQDSGRGITERRHINGNDADKMSQKNVKKVLRKDDEDVPKETANDWLVLFCAFGSNVIMGMDYGCLAVFYPLLVEYFEASAAQVAWCFSIQQFVSSILSLSSSYPIQLYGCRMPGVIGSTIFCFSVIMTSFAPSLLVIYLTYGIMSGIGTSFCLLTPSIIVQQRFHRNRNLVNGIAALGLSLGTTVGPLVCNLLLEYYSWRATYIIMGAFYTHRIAFSLLFVTPHRYLSSRTQTDPTILSHRRWRQMWQSTVKFVQETFDFSILRQQKIYALFVVVSCLQVITLTAFLQHSVNRAVHAGISLKQASWAVSLFGIANTVIRITISLVGNLSCVNRSLLYAVGMFFAVISVLILLLTSGLVGTITSAVLQGIMAGCTNTINVVVTVDLVGVKLLARCLAIQMFFTSFFRLTTSPFMGRIFDVTKNYDVPFTILGCCGLLGGCLMFLVFVLQKRQQNLDPEQPGQPEQQLKHLNNLKHMEMSAVASSNQNLAQ